MQGELWRGGEGKKGGRPSSLSLAHVRAKSISGKKKKNEKASNSTERKRKKKKGARAKGLRPAGKKNSPLPGQGAGGLGEKKKKKEPVGVSGGGKKRKSYQTNNLPSGKRKWVSLPLAAGESRGDAFRGGKRKKGERTAASIKKGRKEKMWTGPFLR